MTKRHGQGVIMDTLNHYLKWNDLPVRLSEVGYCHGLCMLHDDYFFAGQLEKFKEILNYISGLKYNSAIETEVNHFVVCLILSQSPNQYDTDRTQLKVSDQFPSNFQLTLNTTKENWVNILKELDLKENEALSITYPWHTVRVTKKNNQFLFYDPNLELMTFETEEALMAFLDQKIGLSTQALNIHIRTRSLSSRQLPSPTDFYNRYITPENTTMEIQEYRGKNTISLLSYAANRNDTTAVSQFIEKGATDISDALIKSISNNAIETLILLLSKIDLIPDKIQGNSTFEHLICVSLIHGRKRAFEVLLKNQAAVKSLDEMIANKSMMFQCINYAIKGNHPDLLTIIQNKAHLNDEAFSAIILNIKDGEDSINYAIKNEATFSVKFLLQKTSPSQEQRRSYLMQEVARDKLNLMMLDCLFEGENFLTKADVHTFLITLLAHGRSDAYHALIEHEAYKKMVDELMADEKNRLIYIDNMHNDARLCTRLLEEHPALSDQYIKKHGIYQSSDESPKAPSKEQPHNFWLSLFLAPIINTYFVFCLSLMSFLRKFSDFARSKLYKTHSSEPSSTRKKMGF